MAINSATKDRDPDKENKLTFFIWMQISDKQIK